MWYDAQRTQLPAVLGYACYSQYPPFSWGEVHVYEERCFRCFTIVSSSYGTGGAGGPPRKVQVLGVARIGCIRTSPAPYARRL